MAKPPEASKPVRKVDSATKTVAAILQEFGRQAFDIADRSEDALQEMCNRWIAHLLLGEASPSRSDLKENWFDWPGVRDFVSLERGREKSYVVKNIDAYQDLALSLLRDFSASVQCEQEADGQLRDHLEVLNSHAKTKSNEELREQVLATITRLNEVLEAKKNRQETQLHSLSAQVETLKTELSTVRETAQRDGLTQLYNRRAFDECVARCMESVEETSERPILFLCDIDKFKNLNDTHGHQFGDEVLQGVAKTLQEVFGEESDFVARYGGEEFAIVQHSTLKEARIRGAQLLDAIRALRFESEGREYSVTISVGVASLKIGELGSSWIGRSDRALYASKNSGRNRMTIEGS